MEGEIIMKKNITILALLIVLLSLLAGCGQKVECDFCNEVKKCETRYMLGEGINICKDCVSELEGLVG